MTRRELTKTSLFTLKAVLCQRCGVNPREQAHRCLRRYIHDIPNKGKVNDSP